MVDVSDRAKVKWHGRWIWADYVQPRAVKIRENETEIRPLSRTEMNVYVLFRRHIEIREGLTQAILDITADSRYKLFVNGHYVGRGINRCESQFWYYNRHDITAFLQPGPNILAIHARFYGKDLSFYMSPDFPGGDKSTAAKGGLLFDLQCLYSSEDGEKTEWIGSNEVTKCIVNAAEKSLAASKGGLGFLEDVDSRLIPKEWNEVDFDDSVWNNATIYDYPITTLLLDENAPLFEEEVFPIGVLNLGEVLDSEQDIDPVDLDQVDFNILNNLDGVVQPLSTAEVTNVDALLGKGGICEISSPAQDRAIAFMLYFDQEVVGYPRFVVDGPAGTTIDFVVSEKIKTGQIEQDVINTKRGSRVILRGGPQFFEQWDWDGFLGIQVKIRNLTAPLKISKFCVNRTHMQVTHYGKFSCDNPQITELWNRCAHTLLCCAVDGYLDCPQREQRSYLGDAYVEVLVAATCFGEPRLTKKILLDAAFGQRHDGVTYCIHPGDYKNTNFILIDYTLYWIQIAWDYYRYFGDATTLLELYPHFLLAVQWFWKFIEPQTGLLTHDIPYTLFIDWAYGQNKPGINGIVNAQFADCLEIVANIAEMIGNARIAVKYRQQSQVMREQLDALFWDPVQGCYRDSSDGSQAFGIISQHTNSYFAIKSVAPVDKWSQVASRVFDQVPPECEQTQINTKRPKSDFFLEKQHPDTDYFILQAMPFFMHHVHRFLASINRFDLILHYFEIGWLPMVEQGKTKTIWETWVPVSSECHEI